MNSDFKWEQSDNFSEEKMEEIIKNALGLFQKEGAKLKKEGEPRERCFDEGLIARYLDGCATTKERAYVEEHLSSCHSCQDVLVSTFRARAAESSMPHLKAPENIVERAKSLISEKLLYTSKKTNLYLYELIINGSKKILKLFKFPDPVILVNSPLPILRRLGKIRGDSVSPEYITYKRNFGGFEFLIEIEKSILDDIFNIKLITTDSKDKNPPKEIRFSLLQAGKELASYPVLNNFVIFEKISKGEYIIKIMKLGKLLGEISLSLN